MRPREALPPRPPTPWALPKHQPRQGQGEPPGRLGAPDVIRCIRRAQLLHDDAHAGQELPKPPPRT